MSQLQYVIFTNRLIYIAMKKFLLSLLLVLVSSFAYGAVGDGFIVDGLRFIVTSEEHHEVEVTDYNYIYHNSSTDVVIPAQVTHNSITYTVVSIGENGFYHKDLTSVMIPATVREIGMYAFFSCNSLTAVDIPESVSEIGQCAFGYFFYRKFA